MIFSVEHIVSYCSQFMTLLPGDVIVTGTPEGIGWARQPRRMLKPDDTMRLAIEKLGEQRQNVVFADHV